jgi:hypothetical protein
LHVNEAVVPLQLLVSLLDFSKQFPAAKQDDIPVTAKQDDIPVNQDIYN